MREIFLSKAEPKVSVGREPSTGRFATTPKKQSVSFSTDIVTKRGNISASQAQKAVRDYLREHSEKN